MNLRRAGGRLPLVIGHRGARPVAPENTLEALAAAVEAGADLVEFDVGAGPRARALAARVADAARLDDALEFLRARDRRALDLKAAGIEREVVDAFGGTGSPSGARSSRPSPRSLDGSPARAGAAAGDRLPPRPARRRARPWPRAADRGRRRGAARGDAARACRVLLAGRARTCSRSTTRSSRAAAVRAAHARGAAVFAWTVDDPGLVERLAAAGVDAIVSDDPEWRAGPGYTEAL